VISPKRHILVQKHIIWHIDHQIGPLVLLVHVTK